MQKGRDIEYIKLVTKKVPSINKLTKEPLKLPNTFKVAKKKPLSDSRVTVEYLHEKKLNEFEQQKQQLPELIEELKSLKNGNIQQNINRISELEELIDDIKNDTSLNQYHLDFMLLCMEIEEEKENKSSDYKPKSGQLDNFVSSNVDYTKIELYNRYIQKFNPPGINQNLDIYTNPRSLLVTCKSCNSEQMILDTNGYTCMSCSVVQDDLIIDEQSIKVMKNMDNATKDTHSYPEQIVNYKRQKHFEECINQIQAKENTDIPQIIIDAVCAEFKKMNVKDCRLVTTEFLRGILKKLKFNKWYEHVPTIISQICGIPAPKISHQLEAKIKVMFDQCQEPFEQCANKYFTDRQNFLNYNYVFYKFFEMLGENQLLGYFTILKDREILYKHDQCWKFICNHNGWKFKSTM